MPTSDFFTYLGGRFRLFPVALILTVAVMAASAEILPAMRKGVDIALWRPLFDNILASLVIIASVPVIYALNEKFPFNRKSAGQFFFIHLAGSLVFAVAHISWTLFVYAIGDLITGERSPVFLGNLHLEYFREALVYAIVVGVTLAVPRLDAKRPNMAPEVKPGIETITLIDRGIRRAIACDEIHWIESAGNYVIFHSARGEHIHRATLKETNRLLPGGRFLRISRSTIVNVAEIEAVVPDGKRDHAVVLRCKARLRIARGQKLAIEDALSS